MIKLFSDNKEIPVNMLEFSDGAITFKVEGLPSNPRYISFDVLPYTPVYRVREELSLLWDAVDSLDVIDRGTTLILNLPYLPYSRADRRFESGNPIPLENFLTWLACDMDVFDEVHICDIHNKSAVEEFYPKDFQGETPIIEKTQLSCFKDALPQDFNTDYDFILAPDKGAVDKARSIAEYLEVDVYTCEKKRDLTTGKIIKSTLPKGVDFEGKIVLIPDDCCDGNFTFFKLSELLKEKGAKKVDLYITHLIGSKGLDNLKGLIDKIYFYHIVGDYLTREEVLRFNDGY